MEVSYGNVVSASSFLLLFLGNGIYTHKNNIGLYIYVHRVIERNLIEGKDDQERLHGRLLSCDLRSLRGCSESTDNM